MGTRRHTPAPTTSRRDDPDHRAVVRQAARSGMWTSAGKEDAAFRRDWEGGTRMSTVPAGARDTQKASRRAGQAKRVTGAGWSRGWGAAVGVGRAPGSLGTATRPGPEQPLETVFPATHRDPSVTVPNLINAARKQASPRASPGCPGPPLCAVTSPVPPSTRTPEQRAGAGVRVPVSS